jgi:hypothetical protein
MAYIGLVRCVRIPQVVFRKIYFFQKHDTLNVLGFNKNGDVTFFVCAVKFYLYVAMYTALCSYYFC